MIYAELDNKSLCDYAPYKYLVTLVATNIIVHFMILEMYTVNILC